ncbi:MAG: response regulator transcription factor [Spirochaetales bacterium]|nr:response regulator transcription factor [Spirochaetales bacterium]
MKEDIEKKRVLIVDDHPIVRQGITRLINYEEELMVCGEAGNAKEALETVERENPDLVIVDISLKGRSGLELIKDIRMRFQDLPVLVVSMHDESLYAERVLRAGAKGYIMKQEPPEKVLDAIRQVLGGKIFVSEKMREKMLQRYVLGSSQRNASTVERLSDRELEVFRLIGKGMGTRQIAKELDLSIKTVETYREHIKEKLNLENSSKLLQYAIDWVQNENPK